MITKYRAWIKAEKRMARVTGLLFDHNTGDLKEVLVADVSDFGKGCVDLSYKPEEIDLMQFVGMEDVEDREIYADDILAVENDGCPYWLYSEEERNAKYLVVWDKKYCGFLVNTQQEDKCWVDDAITPFMRVIGNIHENPELLEVKE